MSVEYLGLTDFLAIAVEITGLDIETLMRRSSISPTPPYMRPRRDSAMSSSTKTSSTRLGH